MEICQGCNQHVATAHLFFDYDGELRCIACLGKKEREEEMKRTIKVGVESLEEIKAALEQAYDPTVAIKTSEIESYGRRVLDIRKGYIKVALRAVESLLVIA